LPQPRTGLALADSAAVLTGHVRDHLDCLFRLLQAHVGKLDRAFRRCAAARQFDAAERNALSHITPGAAALFPAGPDLMAAFIEQVEYNGRRLAKMNTQPEAIVRALDEYGALLDPLFRQAAGQDADKLRRARDELHFCTILTLNNAFFQVREAESRALYDLLRAEHDALNMGDLLRRCADVLARAFRASASVVHLYPWPAARSRRPRYIETGDAAEQILVDASWRGEYASYWSIPMLSRGRAYGLMQFAFAKPYRWLPREVQLLEAAAERCLAAAEKARLLEQLWGSERQVRALAARMVRVEEEERRRISRELHDEAGQSMLLIRLQLEMLESAVGGEVRARVAETREVTERTILEIRRIISALSPAVLEQLGLDAAIRQLVSRFGKVHPARVDVRLAVRGRRLPAQVEAVAYRLVQESLNNIARHSRASHVNIRLRSTDRRLELNISDDGVGFEAGSEARKRQSFGIAGMRQRVALLGGTLEISSSPKEGTKIQISLPLDREGQAHPGKGSRSRRSTVAAQESTYGEDTSTAHG
jgi:signal transduction histidine kinase